MTRSEGAIRLPNLRRARLRRALSQRDLAKASGVSQSTVQYLEAGRPPGAIPSTVRKLAGALGIEPHELMDAGT
jgi:transcriptional regulator with XRE-family HTH domain